MENENLTQEQNENNDTVVVETEETTEETQTEKVYNQEQVNEIVRARLDKAKNNLYKSCGVETKEQLEELVKRAGEYDSLNERLYALKGERDSFLQELAFLKNNINPSKQDDILAYFKGKELELTQDNLASEIETHPEWINPPKQVEMPKTTIKVLGVDQGGKQEKVSEKDDTARLFGLSHFVR